MTYLASTGDAPGVSFPSTSAYVVAVGGTAIRRNHVTGNFGQEVVWQDAGAGLSAFVARPAFQNAISGTVGASRGVPDIAAIANPSRGSLGLRRIKRRMGYRWGHERCFACRGRHHELSGL